MSDCGGDDTGGAEDRQCAPDTATHHSSSCASPSDYSTCTAQGGTENSNHHSRTTDTKHSHRRHSNLDSGNTDTTKHSHRRHSNHSSTHSRPISEDNVAAATVHIPHDTAPSAPLHQVSPGSENRHDEHVAGSNRQGSRASYDPSYMMDKPTTGRPKQYGKKTIVLNTTDDQNSPNKIQIRTGLLIGLALITCSIVPIGIAVYIFGTPSEYSSIKAVVNNCDHEPCDLQNDGPIFHSPRDTTVDPYLTDKYKDTYDESYGEKNISDAPSDPLLDDEYENSINEIPRRKEVANDILLAKGISGNDLFSPFKTALRATDEDLDDPVIKRIVMGDEMKNRLGIPRDENTKEKPFI